MWRIAVHEAGHLLAGHLLGLEKATRAQLSTRGGFVARPAPGVITQATVPVLMQMQLAGRVAERLFFDDVSSGGGAGQVSDLAQATQMALQAEANFGFGPSLAWHTIDRPLTLMPLDVRGRIEARLQEAQADVTHLLNAHRLELERIAMALLERRELYAADLDDLLSGIVPTVTAVKPRGPSDQQFAILQRPIMTPPHS
jgi:ATP-dependent Zn protease